jgi:hypothetical protein
MADVGGGSPKSVVDQVSARLRADVDFSADQIQAVKLTVTIRDIKTLISSTQGNGKDVAALLRTLGEAEAEFQALEQKHGRGFFPGARRPSLLARIRQWFRGLS